MAIPNREKSGDGARRYDAVIWDLGGVLLNVNWLEQSEEFLALCDAPREAIAEFFKGDVWDALERGKISFNEFAEAFAKVALYRGNTEELKEALTNYSLSASMFDLLLRVKMGKWVQAKRGELWMLSNISEVAHEGAKVLAQGLFYNFENGRDFVSYKLGFRKPEIEAFRSVCELGGSSPDRCILVDDMIENCKAASSLGMKYIHCMGDCETVESQLEKFGIDATPRGA